jgi:hypothetical protein
MNTSSGMINVLKGAPEGGLSNPQMAGGQEEMNLASDRDRAGRKPVKTSYSDLSVNLNV